MLCVLYQLRGLCDLPAGSRLPWLVWLKDSILEE